VRGGKIATSCESLSLTTRRGGFEVYGWVDCFLKKKKKKKKKKKNKKKNTKQKKKKKKEKTTNSPIKKPPKTKTTLYFLCLPTLLPFVPKLS